MTTAKKKSIYTVQNTYPDRVETEEAVMSELTVKIGTIETAMLLLSSMEESVLITVFKHLLEYSRPRTENIAVLREKGLLDLLQEKNLLITNESVIIKRFALYLTTVMIENMNTLEDLEVEKVMDLLDKCVEFYNVENDTFCIEYLSAIINKCLDDPRMARNMLQQEEYLKKLAGIIKYSDSPDIMLQSFEALEKMLRLLNTEDLQTFVEDPHFPVDRLICEICNPFTEIRTAVLKLIKRLLGDQSKESPLNKPNRSLYVIQQLTKVICDPAMIDSHIQAIEVLAAAMRNEDMVKLFFEHNFFDKILQTISSDENIYTPEIKCKAISIFAETTKYTQFLRRLHEANITEALLNCLLNQPEEPAPHILFGLNGLMKYVEAANYIVDAYQFNLINRLLSLISNENVNIKTRELSAELINKLLEFAFHDTAYELFDLNITDLLAAIFNTGFKNLSVDLILPLLDMIEKLAQNEEYRTRIGASDALSESIAILLKEAFPAALVLSKIYRCLSTIVDEEPVRKVLLQNYICASLKRALKSLSNAVKSSATNFIIQAARFPEFIEEFIETGVLEVLMTNQKFAFCVSTWAAAIEAILSKSPTLKFCIRHQLAFTDSTVNHNFIVSNKKFDDFRIFLNILKQEVSPLTPMLVINFNRPENPSTCVVYVSPECFSPEDEFDNETGWCYCRTPGDAYLPVFLTELFNELDRQGLMEDPEKMKRCIDFDNLAKRARILAKFVAGVMNEGLESLDINSSEECSQHVVVCHLKELVQKTLHCNVIPVGMVRSGCKFERACLFKAFADQIGLPSTLQRSVDGRYVYNEVPLPIEIPEDIHCDRKTMKFMPWRMLRPTHIVDLMYNVGELYPLHSRQYIQYLRLF
ncbi:uncharacterized protein LOC119684074 [Teleopsis dalmanni]|uniref:uncharacterized protein LOC119684074 n=1 Tax=Teleopsis dalmanni TaxID=139649 RepID=UPI0018CFEAF3|nr:uncharacterized protein LOC119684074 [Teleopsis dalmanni]